MKKLFPLLAALAGASLAAAQAQTVRQVPLDSNDIIYDAHSARIYASSNANCITPVEPVSGTLGTSIFVGSEPNRLALSDDGSELYVGLDGAASVLRVNLPTQTPDLQFSLGNASFFGPYYAANLAVLPGAPHSVAVSRRFMNGSSGVAGVAIFDDAVQRPTTTSNFSSPYYLAFNPASGVLYGSYSSDLYTMTVNASGVSVASGPGGLANGPIAFDGGLIYSISGQAVDPVAQAAQGTFTGFTTTLFGGYSTSLATDAAHGRIFFLLTDPTGQSSTVQIVEYDTATYRPLGALTVSGVSGTPGDLITWGATGLAFRTSNGQLFLIDSRDLPGLASVTLSATHAASGATATGTVALTLPAPPGGAIVNLSASGSSSAATVPASVTVPAGARSASFSVTAGAVTATTDVTITAAYGVQSGQATLVVQDAAGDSDLPANVRLMTLPSNDMVYDPATAKLYLSVPSGAVRAGASPGNCIVGLDPLTGALDPPVYVGSEPSKLALSGDGMALYAGLGGAGAVRRFDIAADAPGLQFGLGGDPFSGPYYPEQILVVPGTTDSVAVSEMYRNVSPANAGVAIFDSGVARPGAARRAGSEFDSLAFSSDPSRLYALDNGDSSYAFSRLSVGAGGVSLLDSTSDLVSGFGITIQYDSGRVYASTGAALDPEAVALSGTFSGVGSGASVRPDVAHRRVFFVSSPDYGHDGTAVIQAYDPATFLPVGSLTIPGIVPGLISNANPGPSSLIRWGADGLAFRTPGGQIFLVRTSLIPSTQPAPASVTLTPARTLGGTTTSAVVTLAAPAPGGGVALWLSSSNPDLAAVPATVTIPAGQSSATFAVTTQPVTATTPVTISAVSGGATASAALTLLAPTHTHLLWNNADGRVMLWSIAQDGTFTLNGFGPYTDGAPQNKWHATALATGSDGNSHILWNNTDGRVMLWTVDDQGNFTLAGYGPYTDNSVGSDPALNKWSATAVSVGPDNVVHLLWNNTDHRVMLWNVAPDFSFTLAGYGPYTDTSVSSDPNNFWSASALATGPDNKSRIAWNNVDGRVMLWNVDAGFNFSLAGYGPYTDNAPQNKWSATGVSVGPDNLTHLLWSNTDRRAMFWDVNADFSFTLAGYGPYTDNAPQNLWTAAAVATGPDDMSHILWANTDNRAMLWGVDPSFNFTVAGYGPYTDNAPGNLWSATAVSAGP